MTISHSEDLEGFDDDVEAPSTTIEADTAIQLWNCMQHCYVDHLDYPLVHKLLVEIHKRYELP